MSRMVATCTERPVDDRAPRVVEPKSLSCRPRRMQMNRRALILVPLLLLLMSGLAACQPGDPGANLVGAGPLLTVETRGGECVNGPCGSTVIVERDGTVHSAEKPPNALGTIPPDQLAALESAIKLTDFALLKSHPFTGECPVNFDGQEFIFEFGAPGGSQRIATCEVEVDYGSPLFVAVATALGPFIPLPVT